MNRKLAIKGHATRGKEVIELLEMMGGSNDQGYIGTNTWKDEYYFLDNGCIRAYDWCDGIKFTLEEFLEKYPFKVGDIVHIYVQNDDIDGKYDIEVAEIDSMRWNPVNCKIAYKMKNINREFYKEEIKCKVVNNYTKASKMKNVLTELLEHIKTTPKEELEREFNELEEWSNVGPTVEEFMDFCNKINKKPKYPTTYEECAEIMHVELWNTLWGENATEYESQTEKLINALIRLKVCRDAYWKIAGEQMGLGKSWEPDWTSGKPFYCISVSGNIIGKGKWCIDNKILAFPTEEMRDAFYENFKDLIEQCKELL